MSGWTQTILAGLVTAAFLAGASAVVTVAVVSSKANANEARIGKVETKVEAVATTTIELRTDAKWIKAALKELLNDRGLPAPRE